jgi:aspartate/methionine/tyrosine aminotransferase
MLAGRDIAVIADEVFADYEIEEGSASPSACVASSDATLAFSLGGLSKSVGMPQVKLGWIAAAGKTDIVDAALRRLEHVSDTYLSVSTPVQVAAPELLRAGASVRAQILDRVRRNDRQLRAQIVAVPSCTVLRSEGGWYGVIQVPSLESEEDLVLRLLAGGVLTHPGYFFDFPRESFLIVSLLPPCDVFRDGIAAILRHFACSVSADQHV